MIVPAGMAYFDEEYGHDFWEVGVQQDKERGLLFAVLMQALKDCSGAYTVTDDYRRRGDVAGAGREWFRERSKEMIGWGFVVEELGITRETARKLESFARQGIDPFGKRFSFYRTNSPKRHVPGCQFRKRARQVA